MAPLFTTPLDVTKTKGPKNVHEPTLTTTECNKRDDLITAHMSGLEMLRHINDDAPIDKDKRRTMSDSESDSANEKGELYALEGTGYDDGMDE
ncbi:hypothetical protein H5410_047308 [Solanum commersonii]|uniref:Uncharacterized protein n=1 Tax=Solanum commersonii TaxID=4109 RepID=A0A9J5XGR6_SOLCO|nr:hypothetical protein H5410_047308 [Solanum commersonii]